MQSLLSVLMIGSIVGPISVTLASCYITSLDYIHT